MKHSGLLSTAAALSLSFFPSFASAQYRLHSWENFEQGFPQSMSLGYSAKSSNVQVIPFGVSNGLPPAMLEGIARLECGSGILRMTPSADEQHLSVFSKVSLDRRRLGESGRALYQADVYVSAEGEDMTTSALLAGVPLPDGKISFENYRFGLVGNGTRAFFSYSAKGESSPKIYQQQNLSELGIKRPGWHRLQIIFVGQDRIYCAIDGKPTKFSPITDSSLTMLNAGFMVSTVSSDRPCYIDNVSIQWSAEDVPLPDSPWTQSTEAAAQKVSSPFAENSSTNWLTDPGEAWQLAQRQGRPILVMFYAPRTEAYRYFASLQPTNPQEQALLQKYVPLKVEVNQLSGGSLAQKFNIARVPTLVIMNPQGQEEKRVVVINRETTWESVAAEL